MSKFQFEPSWLIQMDSVLLAPLWAIVGAYCEPEELLMFATGLPCLGTPKPATAATLLETTAKDLRHVSQWLLRTKNVLQLCTQDHRDWAAANAWRYGDNATYTACLTPGRRADGPIYLAHATASGWPSRMESSWFPVVITALKSAVQLNYIGGLNWIRSLREYDTRQQSITLAIEYDQPDVLTWCQKVKYIMGIVPNMPKVTICGRAAYLGSPRVLCWAHAAGKKCNIFKLIRGVGRRPRMTEGAAAVDCWLAEQSKIVTARRAETRARRALTRAARKARRAYTAAVVAGTATASTIAAK